MAEAPALESLQLNSIGRTGVHTHSSGLSLLLGKLRVKPPWLLGRKADHGRGVLELAPQPPGSSYLEDWTLLCNHERLSPRLHGQDM